MTFACIVKVETGIVLAADTALSAIRAGKVQTVWTSARKVFPAYKGKNKPPIGILHTGGDNLPQPVEEVIAGFQTALADPGDDDYFLSHWLHSVQVVTQRLRQYVLEEHYKDAYRKTPDPGDFSRFVVAGYSATTDTPEAFEFILASGRATEPRAVLTDKSGIFCAGQTVAVDRLLKGHDDALLPAMVDILYGNRSKGEALLGDYEKSSGRRICRPAMPLPEAVALSRYLHEVSAGHSRFFEEYATIGAAVEIATLGKHTGFKWIDKQDRWH